MHVLRRPDIVIEVLAAIALALDMVALRRLWTSAFYERRQQWLQSVLVLLLPVAGAWLILGEPLAPSNILFALAVIAVVAAGRKMQIQR